MTTNQLKFNLNAVVDNLNMVNLVHPPKPILIENLHANGSSYSLFGRNQNLYNSSHGRPQQEFEYVDETKMSMYSFLIERELKTKEWLSKYELDHFNESNAAKNSKNKNNENKESSGIKNKHSNIATTNNASTSNKGSAFETKKIVPVSSKTSIRTNLSLQPTKSANDLVEVKKCCDDTIKAMENLEKQLIEFKYERLKIVFNDPLEEEKQKRIQLEQIKYLSRSMYNLQNQMNQLKLSSQSQHQVNEKSSTSILTPLARLTHTMRQVNKLIGVFTEFYPYRPDNNLTSEKLCFHFYKQLHASIQSFGEQLHFIQTDGMGVVSNKLQMLLLNCDKYFSDYTQHLEEHMANKNKKKPEKQVSNKSNQVLNIIRTPRTNNNINGAPALSKAPNNVIKGIKPKKKNSGISIVSASAIIPIKKILPKSRMHIIDAKSDEESVVKLPMRIDISPPPPRKNNIQAQNKKASHLNASINDLDNNEAFQHISSPKVKITPFKVNRKSRSAEKLRQKDFSEKMHKSNSIEKYRSLSNDYLDSSINRQRQHSATPPPRSSQSHYRPDYEKYFNHDHDDDYDNLTQDYMRLKRKYGSSLENLRASFSRTHEDSSFASKFQNMSVKKSPKLTKYFPRSQTPTQLISRIEMMQKENDLIRHKYEKLNYHQSLVDTHSMFENAKTRRRPYEECYLANEAVVREEFESKIDFNKVYKELRRPNEKQINRVIDYANNFYDYNQKTSVTTVGKSKFDDFELFELLSESLFEECAEEVLQELESINDELASNLMNAEFEMTSQQKDQLKSNNNESIISVSMSRRRRASPLNNKQVSQGNYANTSYSSFHSETFNPEKNEGQIDEESDTFTSISSSNV